MLKRLFSSQVRVDLLSVLLMHPEKEFYLRELAVKLSSSPRSINVELRNLQNIGLLIIGKVPPRLMSPLFAVLREKAGREINAVVFPMAEFAEKVQKQDHFISKMINESMLFVIGEEHEFGRLVQKWLAEKTSNQL
jgi:hypothetical protein